LQGGTVGVGSGVAVASGGTSLGAATDGGTSAGGGTSLGNLPPPRVTALSLLVAVAWSDLLAAEDLGQLRRIQLRRRVASGRYPGEVRMLVDAVDVADLHPGAERSGLQVVHVRPRDVGRALHVVVGAREPHRGLHILAPVRLVRRGACI